MPGQFAASLIERCFKERFLFIIVALLSFLILSPLLEKFASLSILLDLFLTAVFISAIYAISHKKHVLLVGILLALPMLASTWSPYFVKIPSMPVIGSFFGILFFGFVAVNILSFVFEQREITLDVIYGAIVVYLLIASTWALLYRLLESIQPGSFSIVSEEVQRGSLVFFYYSFVTITTLGYGEITPVTDVARSLAIIEAVIGQLYLVVTVARLVGIHISQSMQRQ